MKLSFGDYLVQEFGNDAIDKYWGSKNKINPFDISCGSSKIKIWIKCQEKSYHNEYETTSYVFKSGCRCPYCIGKKVHPKDSFAQWGIDNIDKDFIAKYWSDKNVVNPFELSTTNVTKVWIKCQEKDYHSDYEITCANFKGGNRCCYCNSKKVHSLDSFGQWLIDNFGETALTKYWSDKNTLDPFTISKKSGKKVFINCDKNKEHGQYTIACDKFVYGSRCGYCTGSKVHKVDSIGFWIENNLGVSDSNVYWSVLNSKTQYEVHCGSNKKFWFKCLNTEHEDYFQRVAHFKNGHMCPKCFSELKISNFQRKVVGYLKEKNLEFKNERSCSIIPINPKTKRELPFDNEVIELKLIIEVHGQQHYNLLSEKIKWLQGKTPEEYLKYRKLLDRYKKFIAYKNGYEYLELPYWCFEDDNYKKLIDDRVKDIKGRGDKIDTI